MPITLRLTAPITDGDAVGTLVAARVSEDVARKGKNRRSGWLSGPG
jgi:hypothetical protein